MNMYKKFSLLVAIALATVLGAGCGQGRSSAEAGKGQVNKLPNDLEVAQKRGKVVEMFMDKCIECGIAEEKLRKYQPGLEKHLDDFAEGRVRSVRKTPDAYEQCLQAWRERKEEGTRSLVDQSRPATYAHYRNVSSRKDLVSALISDDARKQEKLMSIMEYLGISDDRTIILKNAFLQKKFMDKFLYAYYDFVFASIVKE
jgi:hypothetical protein